MLDDNQRRAKRAKQRERDAGKWLLTIDGEDPSWKNVTSSTGRVGHITGLQFDVVSAHYAGEVKNIKMPALLFRFWNQIVSIALRHGKEPLLIIYPTNELTVLGVPKKLPALHIMTEARHAELLEKERYYDKSQDDGTSGTDSTRLQSLVDAASNAARRTEGS